MTIDGHVSAKEKQMFDYEVLTTASDNTLIINGKLTIENAAELQKILRKTLGEADNLIINLEKVTEVDMSCLQLLCSAHKTFIDNNKSFAITANTSESFTETVKDSGFLRHIGCDSKCDASCLWSESNE